jgi:hypothetical protein
MLVKLTRIGAVVSIVLMILYFGGWLLYGVNAQRDVSQILRQTRELEIEATTLPRFTPQERAHLDKLATRNSNEITDEQNALVEKFIERNNIFRAISYRDAAAFEARKRVLASVNFGAFPAVAILVLVILVAAIRRTVRNCHRRDQ